MVNLYSRLVIMLYIIVEMIFLKFIDKLYKNANKAK